MKGGGIYSFELCSTEKHSMHRFLKSDFLFWIWNDATSLKDFVILVATTELKLASVSFPFSVYFSDVFTSILKENVFLFLVGIRMCLLFVIIESPFSHLNLK